MQDLVSYLPLHFLRWISGLLLLLVFFTARITFCHAHLRPSPVCLYRSVRECTGVCGCGCGCASLCMCVWEDVCVRWMSVLNCCVFVWLCMSLCVRACMWLCVRGCFIIWAFTHCDQIQKYLINFDFRASDDLILFWWTLKTWTMPYLGLNVMAFICERDGFTHSKFHSE